MKTRRDVFNDLAWTWDHMHDTDNQVDYHRLMRELTIAPGHTVCDVGTGTGVLIPLLSSKVGPTGIVVAFDYAENMIKAAFQKPIPNNVRTVVMDVHQTGFPNNCFDQVVCNACFPHFRDRVQVLNEIRRILKPDGVLVISHPTGRRAVNQCHRGADSPLRRDMLPTGERMKRLLQANGFTVLKVIDEPAFYFLSAASY